MKSKVKFHIQVFVCFYCFQSFLLKYSQMASNIFGDATRQTNPAFLIYFSWTKEVVVAATLLGQSILLVDIYILLEDF